jgi:hypothetical protein
MHSTAIKAMREQGIQDTGALCILLFLQENSSEGSDQLSHCGLAVWEIAQGTGLSEHQVKRGLRALSESGAIVRRQLVKAAGEAAVTVLTDRAQAWLGGAGQGSIPAELPKRLRELLIFESPEFVAQVAHCWRDYEALPESLRAHCSVGDAAFEEMASSLRQRLLDAAEQVALAHADERAEREQVAQGIIPFQCDDGEVAFDTHALQARQGAVAAIDLLLVRDVLRRVKERCPGMVTVARLPILVAEIGYSRTIGFVAHHDAELAQRVLVATLARGGWGRPKGIKESFYVGVSSAARFSTGVRQLHH